MPLESYASVFGFFFFSFFFLSFFFFFFALGDVDLGMYTLIVYL